MELASSRNEAIVPEHRSKAELASPRVSAAVLTKVLGFLAIFSEQICEVENICDLRYQSRYVGSIFDGLAASSSILRTLQLSPEYQLVPPRKSPHAVDGASSSLSRSGLNLPTSDKAPTLTNTRSATSPLLEFSPSSLDRLQESIAQNTAGYIVEKPKLHVIKRWGLLPKFGNND